MTATKTLEADTPRNAGDKLVAEKIAFIFHDIFNVDVGADDDFFDLGGDSLAGETLLAGIERDIGISLPLSILLESSTPRTLAVAVEARKKAVAPTILYAVNNTGSQTPLICIHGANGTAGFARKFRDVLPDRPIYAIRALGFMPGEIPLLSVPEIAQRYIGEIRKVRPKGPYHLFGQCRAANVAFEVAQQLSQGGERVATLTLGDPLPMERQSKYKSLRHWLKGKQAIRTAMRNTEMNSESRWHKIAKPALFAALKAYEPRTYRGKAMIVTASDRAGEVLHPMRGYPALVPDLEAVVVEGTHRDVFADMNPGAGGKLAVSMSSFLARHD